jgi:hypothetical protein
MNLLRAGRCKQALKCRGQAAGPLSMADGPALRWRAFS